MKPDKDLLFSPPQERESVFIEKYSFIEDPQERLQAVCSYRCSVAPVQKNECTDANLVQGCSSPVWLTGRVENGKVILAMSSPTPLVSSLAGVVCDLCNNARADDIQSWEPQWLQGLRIDRHLSSTRQNGLAAILNRIREIATPSSQK